MDTAAPDAPDVAPWTGPLLPLVAAWVCGALILAGLIAFIMHFGAIEVFVMTFRRADPAWLAAAIVCQIVTYVCAATIWSRVLKRAGSHVAFASLLRLALVELFANQAVPTGGLSGSLMVMHGLTRRGVDPATAITALLIAALSFYAAYFLAGLLGFVALWHSGDLNNAWRSLLVAFVVVVAALATGALILSRSAGTLVPAALLRLRPFARLANMLSQVRNDVAGDPRLIGETVALQLGVFALDATTLWCACQAVGLHVDIGGVYMSFVLASVVATLSPLPLGLGSFEGTCVGLLHVMGGGLEASLAATLILRGLTLWAPMLPGLWLIRRETKAFVAAPSAPVAG
jgi:hypothetical protein